MLSSVIAAMHYDEHTAVLTIVYRGSRGRYRYFDVPADVWSAFQAAPSKGTFLNTVFKEKGYRYERVRKSSGASDSERS